MLTRDISKHLAALRSDQPAVMKAFNGLLKASLSDGALTEKTKAFAEFAQTREIRS